MFFNDSLYASGLLQCFKAFLTYWLWFVDDISLTDISVAICMMKIIKTEVKGK